MESSADKWPVVVNELSTKCVKFEHTNSQQCIFTCTSGNCKKQQVQFKSKIKVNKRNFSNEIT